MRSEFRTSVGRRSEHESANSKANLTLAPTHSEKKNQRVRSDRPRDKDYSNFRSEGSSETAIIRLAKTEWENPIQKTIVTKKPLTERVHSFK